MKAHTTIYSPSSFCPMMRMKLCVVLVKTIHLAYFSQLDYFSFSPFSIQMSLCCCSLKEVEQFVSHCYMSHETIA